MSTEVKIVDPTIFPGEVKPVESKELAKITTKTVKSTQARRMFLAPSIVKKIYDGMMAASRSIAAKQGNRRRF